MAATDPRAPIVVGWDGREQGRDALALARLLAGFHDADLIVVSALTYAPTEIDHAEYPRVLEADRERLAEEARAALGEASSIETVAIASTSAVRAIHDLAEERDARLVVLGSSHHGKLGRVLLGSTGERLLGAAPCAVAIAPRGYADGEPRELRALGLAYDGTEEAQFALEEAVQLAAAANATLHVRAVLDPADTIRVGWGGTVPMPAYPVEDREARRRELDRQVTDALDAMPSNVAATGKILEGDAAKTLIAASEEQDLLVIGSRGYGPLKRAMLGGVSVKVVRSASCPVLVVPRPEAAST